MLTTRRTVSTLALAVILPSGIAIATATAVVAAPSHSAALPAYPPTPPPTGSPSPTPTPTPTVTPSNTPTTSPSPTPSTGTTTVTNGGDPIKPGDKPKAHAPKGSFDDSSTVTIVIHGPNGYKRTYTVAAGPKGGLLKGFKLPTDAPTGKYKVTLKGTHHGDPVTLLGTFIVKKK